MLNFDNYNDEVPTISGLPKAELEDAKEFCKQLLPQILGLEEDSHDGYICPLCGSGSGPHGTGMTTRDGIHYRCWACGESHDVYSLAKRMEENGLITLQGSNIFEKVYREAGLLDMTSVERKKLYGGLERPKITSKATFANHTIKERPLDSQTVEIPDYTDKYVIAKNLLYTEKGKLGLEYLHNRGLSDATIMRFGIGFEPPQYCSKLRTPTDDVDELTQNYPVINGWIDTTNGLGAILLPVSKDCYVLRNLNKESPRRYAKVTTRGNPFKLLCSKAITKELYAIFIVEGYFDALSIEEVGFHAIPIGTVGAPKDLQRLIANAYQSGKLSHTRLIICEDNDEAGENGLQKIKRFLNTFAGINYCCCDPCQGITDSSGNPLKDANDALIHDRDRFIHNLEDAISAPVVKTGASDNLGSVIEAECCSNAETFANEVLELQSTASLDSVTLLEQSSSTPSLSANVTRESIVTPAVVQLEQLLHEDGSRFIPISTGLPDIDELLMGGLRVGLYGLQGMSGTGKSTMAIQICDNIAETGRPVLYVSLEMSLKDIISKSLARLMFLAQRNECRFSGNLSTKSNVDILMKNLSITSWNDDDNRYFSLGLEKYRPIANKLFIVEGGMVSAPNAVHTVDRIEDCMIDIYNITGRYPIVCVDYIQKLKGATVDYCSKNFTEKQVIDDSVFNLRQLATKYSVPVIGILSMNRQSYTSGVSLSSAKGSGDIEYSCDVLLGLEQSVDSITSNSYFKSIKEVRNVPKSVQLKTIKNRYGIPNSCTTLDFYGKECCYLDLMSQYPDDIYGTELLSGLPISN